MVQGVMLVGKEQFKTRILPPPPLSEGSSKLGFFAPLCLGARYSVRCVLGSMMMQGV